MSNGGCGSGGCGCASGEEKNTSTLQFFCPKCSSKGHPVPADTARRILNEEAANSYTGNKSQLCLNRDCNVSYFDSETMQSFTLDQCQTGIWFKNFPQEAQAKYVCYCQKITEEEIVTSVVETGLDDLGSVMLYLRESFGEDCENQNPAAISCNNHFQEIIEKGLNIREGLQKYKHLIADSKEIPYEEIERRYTAYMMAHGQMANAGSGGGCCGGGCGC